MENDTLFEKVYYSHLTGKTQAGYRLFFEQVLNENRVKPGRKPYSLMTARSI